MKMLTVGMNAQEAAAMDFLATKALPGWHSESVISLAEVPCTGVQLCVLDLPGLGMPRYSPALAEKVMQALKDLPTILITMLHDQSWSAFERVKPSNQSLIFIRKPYKAQDMRSALEQQAERLLTTETGTPSTASLGSARQLDQSIDTDPIRSAKVATVIEHPVLEPDERSVQEFLANINLLARDVPTLFLRKLEEALSSGETSEFRFTLQHSMLVCPEEGWVATNTPMGVIQRLVASDGLASVVRSRRLSSNAGFHTAKRLNMRIEPLQTFLWELIEPISHGLLARNILAS